MIVWRFRYDLPLASAISVGGRRDVPPEMRGRYEDAAALIDEARRIQRVRRRDVEREAHHLRARPGGAVARRPRARDDRREVRRPGVRRGPRARRPHRGRAPRALAKGRNARVRRVDRHRRGRRADPPRLRRRGVQDPERIDYPDAPHRRSHLRQQVHLRPPRPLDEQAALYAPPAIPRGRDGLQVPREHGAGLHQARDRPARRHARGDQRPPGDQRLARAPLPRRPVPLREPHGGALRRVPGRQILLHPVRRRPRRAALRRDGGLRRRARLPERRLRHPPGPLPRLPGGGVGDGRQPQQQPRLAELARRARRGRALREHQGPRDVRVDELPARRRHRPGPALREQCSAAPKLPSNQEVACSAPASTSAWPRAPPIAQTTPPPPQPGHEGTSRSKSPFPSGTKPHTAP